MDGQQFDRWTRWFARTSRREAITLLVAGVAAGPLAAASARGVLAQVAPEDCGTDGDKCKNNGECCDGFKCNDNDKCKADDSNNDGCGKDGDHCDSNGDCCDKYKCNDSNKCKKKK